MKRFVLIVLGVVVVASGCSFTETSPTTTAAAPVVESTTTSPAVTTTAPQATTTTGAATTTTTTLARIPEALPIVNEPWEWTRVHDVEWAQEARFDGTYLAYGDHIDGAVSVRKDGQTILRHLPRDGQDWLVQDIELGDHWLAVVANTSELAATPIQSHAIVYDVETAQVIFEEFWDSAEGTVRLPEVSLSGGYMAFVDPLLEPACITLLYLDGMTEFGRICADAPVVNVDLEGSYVTFDTSDDGCRSVWSAHLWRRDHDLIEHGNRECWSNSPVGGANTVAWFETPPEGGVGGSLIIGEHGDNGMVVLGRGAPGRAETCWNRTYWNGGNGDIREWDGGDTVSTIHIADETSGFGVSCVGPWVSFSTADGIYVANMFSQSSGDACSLVAAASPSTSFGLAASLKTWVHDQYDEPPADLVVTIGSVIHLDGWWVGRGSFSSHLESAVFLWSPDGGISVAWSGSADSEYELREYMLAIHPEAPGALFGCVDVSGHH